MPYQQQHSLSSVPVTTFDNSNYHRASSALETSAEKGISKTSPPLPPSLRLSSIGTFAGHGHLTAIASDTQLPRREGTPPHPASVTKDKAQKNEEEKGEEEGEDGKSEGTTSSKNSVSSETSETDPSTKNANEHKHERKNRNDADMSKKEEKVEEKSEEPSSVQHSPHLEHLKTEKEQEKGKADVKMQSDGIDAHGSSKAPPKKADSLEDMAQKRDSSGSDFGLKKNILDVSADEVDSPRERKQ